MTTCWLELRTRDRKVASSNTGRSGGGIFADFVSKRSRREVGDGLTHHRHHRHRDLVRSAF